MPKRWRWFCSRVWEPGPGDADAGGVRFLKFRFKSPPPSPTASHPSTSLHWTEFWTPSPFFVLLLFCSNLSMLCCSYVLIGDPFAPAICCFLTMPWMGQGYPLRWTSSPASSSIFFRASSSLVRFEKHRHLPLLLILVCKFSAVQFSQLQQGLLNSAPPPSVSTFDIIMPRECEFKLYILHSEYTFKRRRGTQCANFLAQIHKTPHETLPNQNVNRMNVFYYIV